MALVRMGREVLNPMSEFERIQSELNKLFDLDQLYSSQGLFDRAVSPAVDIVENADDFVVTCDLPGVSRSDLDISIASSVLTIKGEKKSRMKGEKVKLYKQETWEGNFQRTLSLPDTVDANRIEAAMDSGVLTIRLPKKEEVKPRQIQIKAK